MAGVLPPGLEVLLSLGVCAAALLVRLAVSLHPHSGEGQPPMYGDYEAQRHWMEVTYNLPIHEWYENTTDNDLQYWGLDYPPLTAYHSWLCGSVAHYINPTWVALHTSRGFESYDHKLFMRYTVLVVDVLVYFTATLAFSRMVYRRSQAVWERISLLALLLLQPALILIDHGHFQYNCVSLGLTVWAVIAVTTNHDIIGSILFSLALNYKQMELYHSVPFFCYLLGKSLSQSREDSFRRVCLLGVSVLGTFVVVWFPYLGDWNRSMQVWKRLFPFGRGLYEDKVANVWCSLSVVVKLKQLLSLPGLLRLTTVATLTALVPSSWDLLRNPTPYRFILALVNSSLVFFLFSFQVHEKSILLAVLPASLLTHHHPHTLTWFQLLSLFSMYPLLTRDGLALPCWALGGLYLTLSLHLSPAPTGSSGWLHRVAKILGAGSLSLLLSVCVASHLVSPPPHLPHLFPLLTSSLSCLLLLTLTTHTHYLQFTATTATLYPRDAPTSGVAMETTVVKATKTTATDKQTEDPIVYENTGRPINISYPLITDRQKKLN